MPCAALQLRLNWGCFKRQDSAQKCVGSLVRPAPSRTPLATDTLLPPCVVRRRSQGQCCGSVYIPLDPAPPSQLAPWEWNGWLEMCKGTGDIEAALSEWRGCGQGRGEAARGSQGPTSWRARLPAYTAGQIICLPADAPPPGMSTALCPLPCHLACVCREAGPDQDGDERHGGAAPGGEWAWWGGEGELVPPQWA